jgi:hypothetical protein
MYAYLYSYPSRVKPKSIETQFLAPSEDDEPRRMFNFLAWAPRVYARKICLAPVREPNWLTRSGKLLVAHAEEARRGKATAGTKQPPCDQPREASTKSELVRARHARSVWVDLSSLDSRLLQYGTVQSCVQTSNYDYAKSPCKVKEKLWKNKRSSQWSSKAFFCTKIEYLNARQRRISCRSWMQRKLNQIYCDRKFISYPCFCIFGQVMNTFWRRCWYMGWSSGSAISRIIQSRHRMLCLREVRQRTLRYNFIFSIG